MDLSVELQKIYDSEINVRISWFWDGGIEIRLGDDRNALLAVETVQSVQEILPWLQEAIAHFYPNSTYAASLDPEVCERAARRPFQPLSVGQSIRCPHCGALNSSMMDEVFAFICNHCGESITAEPSKVQ